MRTLGPSQERWQVPLALTFRTEFFRNLLGKKDALLSNCQFESELGQCIMKERPLQEVEAGCGAASAMAEGN